MLKAIKKLLGAKDQERTLIDPDFGEIVLYDTDAWQMTGRWFIPENKANICCIDIPGDEEGPSQKAREFLLNKKLNLDKLWEEFSPALQDTLKKHGLYPKNENLKSTLHIESLAGEVEEDWGIAFEADTQNDKEWIYIDIEIKRGKHNIAITR